LEIALLLLLGCKDKDAGDTALDERPALEYYEAAADYAVHGDQGYVLGDWVLGPRAEDPYASLFEGELPFFYLIYPADMTEDEELPVLLWLHGGTIGDDSEAEAGGEFPDPCRQDNVEEFVWKAVTDPSFVPEFMSEHRWVMVAPRNDWCDYYQGQGADDPVNPERHWGYVHTKRVLDFVLSGQAGFTWSGELYGWGTSAGAGAVTSVAARYGGFDGIIFDSGLSSTITYWEITEQPPFEHIFGGPPYTGDGEPNGEIYERYAASSPYLLVAEQGLRVPMYVAWTSQDQQVEDVQIHTMLQTLDRYYTPDGVRWGSHDYNHASPGTTFHVQSIYGTVPWGYGTRAYIEFLRGRDLWWAEAEEGCQDGGCAVGEVVIGEPDLLNFSGESARIVEPDNPGVLYTGSPAPELTAGQEAELWVAVRVEAIDGLPEDTPIGTVTVEIGGETWSETFTAGQFVASDRSGDDALTGQVRETVLSFTPGEAGEGSVTYEAAGSGRTSLDALLYLQ
jgi:hypothetical protein